VDVRKRRWQCGLVLAATVAMLAPVPAGAEEATLIDAVELIRRNRDTEAVEILQRLAERGDSRAQYLLGLAYIEGKLAPRDLVLGYAWLQVAAAGYDGSTRRGAADEAQSAMLKVGPALSGAALIQAEQKAAALIKAGEEQLATDTQRATDALKSPATAAGRVLSGCALEPTLGGCKTLAGTAKETRRCTGDIVSADVQPSTQGPTASIFQPKYPDEARRRIEDGQVIVLVHVDRSGYVCRVTVVQGSGVEGIDDATLKAVRRWRLVPGMRNGEPVEAIHTFAVRFRIEGMDFD
jgi:TonB family protein